jgi:hypothetical protein
VERDPHRAFRHLEARGGFGHRLAAKPEGPHDLGRARLEPAEKRLDVTVAQGLGACLGGQDIGEILDRQVDARPRARKASITLCRAIA